MSGPRMESKRLDSWCRPGSMLIEGEKALMKMASFIPLLTQSCSGGQDGNVLFAKMVLVFASMLQHCRLVLLLFIIVK